MKNQESLSHAEKGKMEDFLKINRGEGGRERGEGKGTYSFNGFEREGGIAIVNANSPRALIVLFTPERRDPRAHVSRQHEPPVQTPNRPQNDKGKQEKRKS